MKTTFICTVLNEEASILDFIESIFNQTSKLHEAIIVDGGSTDNTVKIISDFIRISNKKIKFKIIVKKGNRAVGRNEAIKRSSNEIIVCSDSGCVLDKDWIKNIIKPFEDKSVDVVAGYYKGKARTIFEKCLIPYVLIMPDKTNPANFLPATRSMAFRKSIWEKAGRFPEEFNNNEDYVFAKNLKKINSNIFFEKKAIVYWTPRSNLKDAFTMFYRFALGDSESGILREKVVLIFARYILVFYLLLLSIIEISIAPLYMIGLALILYSIWSIKKNYRYIKDKKALFFLPVLQFVSDFAVILGTTLGLFKRISPAFIIGVIRSNKGAVILVGIYIMLMLVLINKGIPNQSHPFNYFMDEWHQAQAVRAVFTQGSPNVEGSANGSMFHFLLSGLWLGPFVMTGIINPFEIVSSVESLEMQQKLFQIFRLNTLFFGFFSIVIISYIAKKYLKLNTFLVSFLFIVNPIWIFFSNYFKYDIALIFWIMLSFLFLLKYSLKPNPSNFSLSALFCGIALSVKVSAIPLLPILISAFLLFNPDRRKNFGELVGGVLIFFCSFLLFGVPDFIFGKGNIINYLYDNLVITPSYTNNYMVGMSYLSFLTVKIPSIVFGYVLFFTSAISVFFLSLDIVKNKLFNNKVDKLKLFLLISFVVFLFSLIPLKIEARGNRLLVLLPFIVLISSLFIQNLLNTISQVKMKIILCIFIVLGFLQTAESLSWVYTKLQPDPRDISSNWIIENIPSNETIGIENIPIYQFLPDIILKEFYSKEHDPSFSTRYNYQVINNATGKLPSYVILSNEEAIKYVNEFSKKNLLERLIRDDYKKVYQTYLDMSLLKIFRSEQDYFMSGFPQSPISISIYKSNYKID